MPFRNGTISYRKFSVPPSKLDLETIVEKLRGQHFIETETSEASICGWVADEDLYNTDFNFGDNVYNDALHFGLRVDSLDVPANVQKSWLRSAERAAAADNPSGFATKAQKRQAKDQVVEQVEAARRAGTYRRSRVFPLLWDVDHHTLYAAVGGAAIDMLVAEFAATFDLALGSVSAGSEFERVVRHAPQLSIDPSPGTGMGLEGIKAINYAYPEGETPDYPWANKGTNLLDFTGSDFLLYLLHTAQTGKVATANGSSLTVFFDKELVLDCASGTDGSDVFKGVAPASRPETFTALGHGKVPRKATLSLIDRGAAFSASLDATTLAVGGLKLPDSDTADTPRVLFEERITHLRDYDQTLTGAFGDFVRLRASEEWAAISAGISGWIQANA